MQYGTFSTFYEASQALTEAKDINPYDEWWIEEKYHHEETN